MAETMGSLVDKLCVTNNKLWHVQELVYRYQKMSLEEYSLLPPEETLRAWKQLGQLNLDRNALMCEVDGCLNEAVRTGSARVDARVKIT